MAIKIEMLRCFVVVAESGNLSEAADRLGRTPSAVSMMLKQFEEHLGAPLFESDRKSKLTALGAYVLQEASLGVENFDRTVVSISNFASSRTGYVRVACVPSVAERLLPKAVKQFRSAFPDVKIDIQDMDSQAVIRELVRDRVDFGLGTALDVSEEIESEPLFSDQFGIICPTDHVLTGFAEPLNWSIIEGENLIANGLCSHIQHETFRGILDQSNLMVRNTTSLIALVKAGAGVTVLPRLAVNQNDPEIAFLTVKDQQSRRTIDVLYKRHRTLSPAVENFLTYVKKEVSALGFV